ncbi:glucan biosynthesis protein [Saccharospirillum mangrovi]|uniref:glucan biosynthesis protein n=1 Tax=Saccharospirillum mangrovi TaxID=2161747 RepID=UPI0013001DA4|nr:glucan biosynthesis protein G [Saccharospirillum mangrovi]
MLPRSTRPVYWAVAVAVLLLLLVAGLLVSRSLIAPLAFEPDTSSFSQHWLEDQARELASKPFAPDTLADDSALRALSYDQYRSIRFDPNHAVWGDESRPFQLQLFHPGFLHTTPVGIHLVENGVARRLDFDTDVFNYDDSSIDVNSLSADGYAGFRVHHPINTAEYYDEFLVFLGASYFRAVAKNQFYGLSARGLAVNTVGDGDEEFPYFSDFWIEQPASDDSAVIIYALLDSPSLTGAYRFTVTPGIETVMDVDASLYPRVDTPRIGVAPLTSMFMFDTTNRARFDDFRNAVHDSNGLQIQQANGEHIWRPLANPAHWQASSFETADSAMPAGFGLMQRRDAFEQFNDNEARYDKRPSLWVEPLGEWGTGHVELLEIPTDGEYQDNIVAYWQPSGGLKVGQTYRYQYRLHWGAASAYAPEQGRITNTASGRALGGNDRIYVIDYSDGSALPTSTDALRINASTSAGTITDVSGTLVEATGHYQAYVKLNPGEADLAELRVALEVNGQPWGETWLYRWTR